ncbi:MAG: cytochrome c [Acidobacteriaceae bacterium]
MRQKAWLTEVALLVLLVTVVIYGIMPTNIGALGEPGGLETSIATTIRKWYVRRAARNILPSTVVNDASSVSAGEGLYGMACASCHGQDGRKPTPIGKSMYPRVPNLSSAAVQRMSDRELFWVVKNGIRLSGMPGFGNLDSDQELWQVTYYVRSLG